MNIRLYNARIMTMEEAGVITEGEIWVCGNTIAYVGSGKEKDEEPNLVFALGYWISVFLGIRSLDYLNEYRMRNRILPTMPHSDIAI